MPGTIVRALRDAGSRNPVFMIDEIDKMGADFRGDPASAMLEVLDPAQNDTFRDHYLDLEFDLSEVMFIATANILDTIPGPLQDRMETIELAGYTLDEKRHIARRYLVPRQIEANGLKPSQIEFADAALTAIIEEYTREAGVRNLERQIGTICRKVARDVAEGKADGKVKVSAKRARELLGRRRVFAEQRRRTKVPGVATGLAWTPTGGDVLFIEATGDARLGQADDHRPARRRDEGVGAGGALLRPRPLARRSRPELDEDWFAEHDIHIHVPAGAVPKDGPSAGVAMTVALASLVSGRPVRNDVAMTGEVTLTGQVLPIGGLKEKSLAAQRAGIKRVIVPERNEGDVAEIPEHERSELEFVYVDEVSEGDRRGARLGMEAAEALGRGGLSTYVEAVREAARARSRAFWIVAGLTLARRRPALRDARRRRPTTTTRSSPPAASCAADFWHAMDAVGFSESAPPLYYALAWLWTQLTGTGRVRAALALGRWPAWRRSRSPTCSAPSCAAAAPGSPPRPSSPSTRCCSGTRRRRAATRCWSCSARLSRALLRPRPATGARQSRLRLLAGGVVLGPRARDPLLRVLPDRSPRRPGCSGARRREALAGLWDRRRLFGLLLAPLAIHQMSHGHAEWIGGHSLGHRLWETGVDLRRRRDRRHHRPPRAAAARARARCVWSLAALGLLAVRGDRRSGASGGAGAGDGRRHDRDPACGRRCSPRARTTSSPATCCRPSCRCWSPSAIGVDAARRPPRSAPPRRALVRLLAGLLRLGQRLARPAAAGLGRGRGEARGAARRRGRWSPGRSAQASLRYYLSTGSFQVRPAEGYDWCVHEVDFISDGPAPPPPRRLLGPRLPPGRLRARRAASISGATRCPGPTWRRLRLRESARGRARLPHERRLLDGIGPRIG